MPALARHLFCAALVAEGAEERQQAAWHFVEAAWLCDDSGASEQARICRQRAAEMFAPALVIGDVPAESTVVHGVMADLLRRAGRYDDALAALEAAEATIDSDDEDDSHASSGSSCRAGTRSSSAILGRRRSARSTTCSTRRPPRGAHTG